MIFSILNGIKHLSYLNQELELPMWLLFAQILQTSHVHAVYSTKNYFNIQNSKGIRRK